jgi:hypothetical protein
MRLIKFVVLMPQGTQALKLAEREVQLPQRPGTVLEQIAGLEVGRATLTAQAAAPTLSAEAREELLGRLEEVVAAQEMMSFDMQTDPGGYLVWFWAEANEALLQQVQRFRQ